jgi:hypothetical protein
VSIEETSDDLLRAIKKLQKMREEMVARNETHTGEFIMLLEVILQCVNYLQILTANRNNQSAIAEAQHQANEYIRLVESVLSENIT